MIQMQQKKFIAVTIVIALVGLIFSLNIDNPIQSNTTSVFNTSNTETTPSNTQLNTQSSTSKTTLNNKQNNNPFDPSQANTTNTTNPHFPPGFPKPFPPLDPEKLKETDDLIATGDAIVAKMDALIATLDLPKIKLSKAEQAQLDTQRQAQQAKLDEIKAQLEALQGDLP
ncbi:hypothetical protein [Bathymodiolus thermophilus thioautotrophic gill symbiont]|uniref:Uncharacterized protein n=2 Tax=Bathymodiolus thermophilus thioautotrophic gill symbiont TaxID=2360 RepID=A0A8H8XBX5_9GAMM|nr:hypothetical protein [Bathymodiolus thermophilus thioautotrophic gill symbiont]CAB5501956.1 hypothetical protein THERMOS_1489 [Bathymodiolus thermophilus thioautotrophic gill symbiont]